MVKAQRDPFAPVIKFESEIHDYGTISKGADGSCEFMFTNIGKDPLIIDTIQSACACMVTSWPKKPIRKGKSGIIKVNYYTKRHGIINKELIVKSNSGVGGTITLKLTGNVQ